MDDLLPLRGDRRRGQSGPTRRAPRAHRLPPTKEGARLPALAQAGASTWKATVIMCSCSPATSHCRCTMACRGLGGIMRPKVARAALRRRSPTAAFLASPRRTPPASRARAAPVREQRAGEAGSPGRAGAALSPGRR